MTADPLDVKPLSAIVSSADCGAVATFVGLVRNENGGRRVLWLEYEAYEPLAEKAFARIDEEAGERWPSIGLAIHHRIGRIEIGEASVVIAAASPHRAEAFAACRYAIERIKQIAPDLEARAFRGGRNLDRGSDRRSGRRRRPADGVRAMHVTIRLFARLREMAGAAEVRRTLPDGASVRARLGFAGRRVSGIRRLHEGRLMRRERGLRAHDHAAERWRRGGVSAAGVRRLELGEPRTATARQGGAKEDASERSEASHANGASRRSGSRESV